MKHILMGGDGFVGAELARRLVEEGEEVVVADIQRSNHAHYGQATFIHCDVRDAGAVEKLPIAQDDVVHNLAAKMLSPIQKRRDRYDFFWPVNFFGARNLLRATQRAGASKYIQFTTDMIYGHTVQSPQTEDHPAKPIGEYGFSKRAIEETAFAARAEGMNVSIFRPRLIIGPGRLGILAKLFKLIDMNLPVPMIGSGKNPYQFVSVYDCAEASRLAAKHGCPNGEYNLGSRNPPSVRALLGSLIQAAGSKSILVPTPGSLVKLTLEGLDRVNMPLMDPEQYKIADEYCVRDTKAAERDLGWVPQHNDSDMLNAAYAEYRAAKGAPVTATTSPVPANK
ncbi:MAG: NAD(P)-dependent oxidoreductase [Pseudomonadota bacterium]